MIVKLTGILDGTEEGQLVIDVQGIGYSVSASTQTLAQLPERGQKLSLWIEHIIRQDHQQLCGFYTLEERHCFRLLLTVQGVGVRVALAILSILSPTDLQTTLLQQDRASLTRAEGVGAKIAGRIVLELKDKILTGTTLLPSALGVSLTPTASPLQEALSGLVGLGYSRAEASQALTKAFPELPQDCPTEVLIKAALQKLAKSS